MFPREGFLVLVLAAIALPAAATLAPAGQQPQEQSQPAAEQPEEQIVQPASPKPESLTPEQRGDIFMARKMYREAIEQYKTLPQSAVVLNKIGIAYHQLMDFRTAERYYKQAIKKDKKYAEAVNNLGTIYYSNRSYRRAVNQYKKALKISPNSASVYSNLGTAYFARKKYDDAMAAYREALRLDPDVFEHRGSFGVLLRQAAIEQRARYHFYMAKSYAGAGLFDRALLSIRRALENGFKEKQKFMEDADFEKMREMPEFQELMAADIRALE
ncbi:MAG: tetratricopeptide repeat protein [bacterium]|jgi:tetratricopeptide (TPR) repeat protein